MSTAAGKRHLKRVRSLSCAVCGSPAPNYCHQGPQGIHGDRTLWRIRKMDELDALAETIRRLVP